MTTGMRELRAASGAACLAIAALASAACFRERERLDLPEVSVALDDTVVAAGGEITGRLHATDGSGLLLVRVQALSAFDTVLLRSDVLDESVVDVGFTIAVKETTPPGTRIALTVSAVDNQDFEVFRDTAVTVRAP